MKSIVRARAFPIYAAAQIGYRLFTGYRNIHAWRRRTCVRPLWHYRHPCSSRNSPFFILGSGASVNEFRRREWDTIREGTSIGINYWVFHDFVPSILMFELCGLQDAFFHALQAREREYASTLLVIRGNYLSRDRYYDIGEALEKIPATLRTQTYFSWDFPVPGLTPNEFRRSVEMLNRLGFYDARDRFIVTAQSKASLGYAVNYAIRSGAKEVVLCGVDLNDVRYFFTADPRYLESLGLPDFDTGQRGTVHKTNDPAVVPLTIADALTITDEIVCAPRGIRISVGSTGSALYPRFPYFFHGGDDLVPPVSAEESEFRDRATE